jgi:hypothetical protein
MFTRTSLAYTRNKGTRYPTGLRLALCIGLIWLLSGSWAPGTLGTYFYGQTPAQTTTSLARSAAPSDPAYSAHSAYGADSSTNTNSALAFSTYLGGKDYDDISAIAVDDQGYIYLTGSTQSPDFPLANPLQPSPGGGWDAFVAKLTPDGSKLVFSTYLGGDGDDFGSDIVLDKAGNIYVAGQTQSSDFPMAPNGNGNGNSNSFQKSNHGDIDAFLVKLNPAGNTILYSTYLGGRDGDGATGVALDAKGDIYLVGSTQSTDFPTANPLQPKEAGPANPESTEHLGIKGDLFITKLKADGSGLAYSTYLGGSGWDQSGGIAVDNDGNAYVAGRTRSPDFRTANPMHALPKSFQDMFVAKLNPSGSALLYSTYLGGSGDSSGGSIAVDEEGNAYIGGDTGSRDFPTANAFQGTNRGVYNLFVTKLNPSGTGLVFSTYLGGAYDVGGSIAVDAQHNVYIAGETASDGFPTVHSVQAHRTGQNDATFAKLDAQGNAIYYSTYLGGSDNDTGTALAVDKGGNAYLAGITFSKDFPVSRPLQPSLARAQDAFIAKFPAPPAALEPTSQFTYWWSGPLTLVAVVALFIGLLCTGILFIRRRRVRYHARVPAPATATASAPVPPRPQAPPLAPQPSLWKVPSTLPAPPPADPTQSHADVTGKEDLAPPGTFVPPHPGSPASVQIPPVAPIPPVPPVSALSDAYPAGAARYGRDEREIVLRGWPLWTVWPAWALANTIGGALGALAADAFDQWLRTSSPGEVYSAAMLTIYFTGSVVWLVLSPFQWMVLKLYLPRMPLASAVWWVIASSIAGIVAVGVGMTALFPLVLLSLMVPPGQAISGLISGAIPGVIIGAAQWLVLQMYLRRAVWWVGVNALAWGLGLGVMGAIFGTLVVASAIVGLASSTGSVIYVGGLVMLAGIVSGLGLLWILRLQGAAQQGRRGPLARFALPAVLGAVAVMLLVLVALPFVYLFSANPLGNPLGVSNIGGPFANDVDRSADGKLLAIANDSDRVRIVDATNNQGVAALSDFQGQVQKVRWSPDGKYLATVSIARSGSIQVRSRSDWQPVITTDPGTTPADSPDAYDSAAEISWSPDSKKLAVGVEINTTRGQEYLDRIGVQSHIKIYDVPSGRNSATLTYPSR